MDTVNTLESGVPNAIRVFEELRRKGHQPMGIRLDSGDLAYLSIQAARMLDTAGFPDTSIVLSNDLDELVIWQVVTQLRQEAPRYGLDADQLIKRLVNPHIYHVSLTPRLWDLKQDLIQALNRTGEAAG